MCGRACLPKCNRSILGFQPLMTLSAIFSLFTCPHVLDFSSEPTSTMVSVNIQPASSRPLAIARNLPSTLDFPGRSFEAVTIGEVKQAIVKQCPKVFSKYLVGSHLLSLYGSFIPLGSV
jgi:hypothetical protein